MKAAPLSPEALLRILAHSDRVVDPSLEASEFSQTLDALAEGVAVYSLAGEPLYTNRALCSALKWPEGWVLFREIQHFASSLVGLIELRGLSYRRDVQELEVRKFMSRREPAWLRGSYIGRGGFGGEGLLLLVLTPYGRVPHEGPGPWRDARSPAWDS